LNTRILSLHPGACGPCGPCGPAGPRSLTRGLCCRSCRSWLPRHTRTGASPPPACHVFQNLFIPKLTEPSEIRLTLHSVQRSNSSGEGKHQHFCFKQRGTRTPHGLKAQNVTSVPLFLKCVPSFCLDVHYFTATLSPNDRKYLASKTTGVILLFNGEGIWESSLPFITSSLVSVNRKATLFH